MSMKTVAWVFVTAISANVLFAASPLESPFAPLTPGMAGQLRARTEFDQKALGDNSSNDPFVNTQLRSRISFVSIPSEKIGIKFELQDSRYMGTEPSAVATNPATSSVGNSKGLDLLQAYVVINEGSFSAALGRQKISLGAGRFLSTLEWSPTSRAFDGLAINYSLGAGNLTALSYLVRDSADKGIDDHLLLSGLYYSHIINSDHQLDAYSFYDQSRMTNIYGGLTSKNYDLFYFGERASGKINIFTYEEEFIWQAGELSAGKDLSSQAFQLATRVGVILGSHKINAGLDMMSGDDNLTDDQSTTYRPNYYFAHAYYGWMDYFTSNPAAGVMDIRLDGDITCLKNGEGATKMSVKPQYHFFLPQSAPAGTDDPYGQEFDLEVHLSLYPKSNLVFGAGFFLANDGAVKLSTAALAANQDYKPGYLLYFMPTFNF